VLSPEQPKWRGASLSEGHYRKANKFVSDLYWFYDCKSYAFYL